MTQSSPKLVPGDIPSGYVPIPILADQTTSALRICALVKETPEPVAGHLVLLRDTNEAKVYLGCIVDTAARVQRWVEIWVQDIAAFASSLAAHRDSLSNSALDARWRDYAEAFERLDSHGIVRTGLETAHPAPIYLDLARGEPFSPVDSATSSPWALCQDDNLLTQQGLAPYSTSLHRYLFLPSAGDQTSFVALTDNAPFNDKTIPLAKSIESQTKAVPLNPGAGFLLIRAYTPLSIEEFAGVLVGLPWDGLIHGQTILDPDGAAAALRQDGDSAHTDGRLMVIRQGRAESLLETLYLKLRIVADALQATCDMMRQLQRPFLGLTSDSFTVSLGSPATGLPFLWTARVVLSMPSDAISISIPGTQTQYFLPSSRYIPPIYWPPVSAYATGRGAVRIPRIHAETDGSAILEITFTTDAAVDPSINDLMHLRLNIDNQRVDIYALCEQNASMAMSEWAFRSIQQQLVPDVLARLQSSLGQTLPNVPFELVPLLSSPCDLYSLAVLAVRILLVNSKVTHAVALDKILSLARQIARTASAEPLGQRIAALFKEDNRWAEYLGPQHLAFTPASPVEAFEMVPNSLWFDVLAALVRMFPGIGPDSFCRDFGDAPPGAVHRAFERPIEAMRSLLIRTRGLIVGDLRQNREMQAVIATCLEAIVDDASKPPAPSIPAPAAPRPPVRPAPSQPPQPPRR